MQILGKHYHIKLQRRSDGGPFISVVTGNLVWNSATQKRESDQNLKSIIGSFYNHKFSPIRETLRVSLVLGIEPITQAPIKNLAFYTRYFNRENGAHVFFWFKGFPSN
jgi:hypothetical protein